MIKKMTQSIEDYLEVVLRLEEKGKRVTVTAAAAMLGVSKSAVNRALKEMAEKGLAVYQPYTDVQLSDEGRRVAEQVFAKHKFLRDFLVRIGVSEQTAEEDCCKLEHALSAESFCRIKALYDSLSPV